MFSSVKRRLSPVFCSMGLLTFGVLLSGCNPPHTADAVVGNQGTNNGFITGAKTDGSGRVVANPSTGAGGRRGLGN